MFDPCPKFLPARVDGLCPFCGFDAGEFPVCRGCGANKIYSERDDHAVGLGHHVWGMIFFSLAIWGWRWFWSTTLFGDGLWQVQSWGAWGVKGLYFAVITFCAFGIVSELHQAWTFIFRRRSFRGFGWKR